jgi:hypothetical protein
MRADAFLVHVAGRVGAPMAGEDGGAHRDRRLPGARRRAETDARSIIWTTPAAAPPALQQRCSSKMAECRDEDRSQFLEGSTTSAPVIIFRIARVVLRCPRLSCPGRRAEIWPVEGNTWSAYPNRNRGSRVLRPPRWKHPTPQRANLLALRPARSAADG